MEEGKNPRELRQGKYHLKPVVADDTNSRSAGNPLQVLACLLQEGAGTDLGQGSVTWETPCKGQTKTWTGITAAQNGSQQLPGHKCTQNQ